MEKHYSNYLKTISAVLDIVILGTISFIIVSSIATFRSIEPNIMTSISTFIDNNIPFGHLFYEYITNNKIIDIPFIIQTYIHPLAIIDIALFSLPFLFLQSFVFFIKKRVMNKENAVIAALVGILLLFAMIMTQGSSFSILKDIFQYDFSMRFKVIAVLLTTQLVLLLSIMYILWKSGHLSIKGFLSHDVASKLVRMGAIPVLTIFLVLLGGLKFVENQTNQARDAISIRFEIDVSELNREPIQIELPTKVQDINDRFHLNIPTTLDRTNLFNVLGIEKINVGDFINSYTLPRFDGFVTKYVNHPMQNVFISIALVVGMLFMEWMNRKKRLSVLYAFEAILGITLFILIPYYLPTILFFLTSVIVVGALLHILANYFDHKEEAIVELPQEQIDAQPDYSI